MSGEAHERLHALARLVESDPGNPHLFRDCVDLAAQLRAFDVMARTADARLRADPADAHARVARAQALMGSGEYARAAEVLQLLAREHADDAVIHQDLGLCYYCLGQFERARPSLQTAYRGGQRSSGLLRLLVSTLHHLGYLEEAVGIADQNAAAAEGDAALAGTYALLYVDDSQPVEAARWARLALSLDAQCVDALTVQATLAMTRAAREEARELFERALAVAPHTGRALIGLGSIALLQQDLPRAVELLGRGVELMRGHVGSWHMLAWAQLFAGDVAAAGQSFETALGLNRNFAETHGGLAVVAALRGESVIARRELETALRLDPASLAAQLARSVLVAQQGNPRQAQAIVRATFAHFTSQPATAFAKNLFVRPPRTH
jgi:tetratricopeptide (TPR) repeat protein